MFTRTTRAKRNIATVALAALVGSLLALSTPAGAADPATEARLDGANRYATAVAVATASGFTGGATPWTAGAAEKIVVVNGENFPDGLSASALGYRIFLTRADSLPTETSDAITALEDATGSDVGEIIVVGGPAVVSPAVFEALDGLNGSEGVTRISGDDRYATALKVAERVDTAPATNDNVIIATGTNFPDALAAGPLAADANAPILLNQGDSLLAGVRDYVVGTTGTVYVVGGVGAVPQSVEDELTAMGKTVKRLGGDTREETAVAIADEVCAVGGNCDDAVLLVNRDSFADALGAGVLAAKLDGSIMPVGVDSISSAVADWHVNNCATLDDAVAVGGTAVVSASTLSGAGDATDCVAFTATATVANSDFTQAVFQISQDDGAEPKDANNAVDAADGVTLTAVAGSAADGVAGRTWTINVTDAAVASASADVATTTLDVALVIPDDGLSQADFVAAWNALGGDATAYFTPAVNGANGNPPKYINDASVVAGVGDLTATYSSGGTQKQTVVVTFSVPVDDNAATAAVLDATDFDFDHDGDGTVDADETSAFASVSPLVGTLGGAAVYTMVQTADDADELVTAGTSIVEISNEKSVRADEDLADDDITLTAG